MTRTMKRLRRRALQATRVTVVMAVATALAVPVAAWAGHQFGDVPDGHIFHADIDWMKDNGVTSGCGDGTNYCPDDFVKRSQMGAFMHRLETKDVFLLSDGKADDADKLDGLNSTAFLRTTGKAADANKLDGLDSTAFLPYFAVVDGGPTPTVRTHRGLLDVDYEATGQYVLTFDKDISACAWTGSTGARNGAVYSTTYFRTIALHSNSAGSNPTHTIRVQTVRQIDGANATAAEDATFNVTVVC